MRYIISALFVLFVATAAWGATGAAVTYQVDGQPYEGYYVSPGDQGLAQDHRCDGHHAAYKSCTQPVMQADQKRDDEVT